MSKFLTFDLGTTLYKVGLFDDAGKLLALERATPPIERPYATWAEVVPDRFLDVLKNAARTLKSRMGDSFDDIVAVSFATQANTFTLLDAAGCPTMPFILWSDQRASSLAQELAEISSLPGFRESTGLPRFGPLLGLAKLLYLRRNRPERFEKAQRFCFLSDYLTAYFTGTHVSEAGVAGLSGALDIAALQWKREVLDRAGIGSIAMPRVRRAGTDIGAIRNDAANAFGLPATCRFVMGCLDQYAGAIGTGTVEPGRMCETTGTVLAAVRCADRLGDRLPINVFQGPGFDENRFYQMSFSSTSANLLEWYRKQMPGGPSFDELTQLAAAAQPSDVVIEAYRDQGGIESAFANVRPEHTPGQVVRAIMQRVAESLARQIDHLCGENRPAEIRSAGGAARNDLWSQIKADTLAVPFVAMECEEPTSLGAAMLAARAIGWGSLSELSKRWLRPRARFMPR